MLKRPRPSRRSTGEWIGYGATLAPPPTSARAAAEAEPSEAALARVRRGFEAFDARLLRRAEDLFTESIDEWRRLERPRQELMSLLVARANVRTDANEFAPAIADLDEALALMEAEGAKRDDGTPRFREYPDALVQRLAHEGEGGPPRPRLRRGDRALGSRRALLVDARAARSGGASGSARSRSSTAATRRRRSRVRRRPRRLPRGRGALRRGRAQRARRDDVLANEALALYALGRADEAVAVAQRVTASRADHLHVLLAADAWRRGGARHRRRVPRVQRLDRLPQVSRPGLREIRRWPDVQADAQATIARLVDGGRLTRTTAALRAHDVSVARAEER